MLIQTHDTTTTLVVGEETFTAVAPGIFEVPEAIGRMLSSFPHFNVADRPLSEYVSEAVGTSADPPSASEPATGAESGEETTRKTTRGRRRN
ncbi:hypothetical protein GCM10025857_06840 [Alicyclobacillus contaminans]|uniref:hypothetical protein n=1 Tax=Alicyclobacillus contaminans TaxID=392016 RepID=UPI00047D5915|nr:hypothetical protein [Alicyclobacillus contaminans]GMA49327.1 hypothetical protein GCM10025857_06840 [Alicyclobacillus contaminans]